MSIWGKLVGGFAGLAIGGPLGAVIGAVAGHAYDTAKAEKITRNGDADERQIAFTTAVIVLAAKMAKADGHVTRQEINAFKEIFHIPPNEIAGVGRIFGEAKTNATGYEPYAQQIAQFYKGNLNVLEEVINVLFYIAESDGHVSVEEEKMIENIAYIFGLTQAQYLSIKESRKTSDKQNPYMVLESSPNDNLQTIRKRYLKLSKEHHPDLLLSKGVPNEVIEESKKTMRSINSAWDQIQKLKTN